MVGCRLCKERPAAKAIGLCAECIRNIPDEQCLIDLHIPVRREFGLPLRPPRSPDGIPCSLCANQCRMAPGERGYCGLRSNKDGRLEDIAPPGSALAYMYLDPLPTNCCAAWFCHGSKEKGYNLSVFLYGCNFDCMFCQNASHKMIYKSATVTIEDMVKRALDPKVRCICFFGGSPEPQLPFTLEVASIVMEKSGNRKHICWEWNGCGAPALVERVAEIASLSSGTIKFDLKCSHPNMGYALCGIDQRRAMANFSLIGQERYRGTLTATTLLVPFYVDEREIEEIARFISGIDPAIPYSLLVFHPEFYLMDLPITPRKQVESCYQAASSWLSRVNIGNRHLLGFAE